MTLYDRLPAADVTLPVSALVVGITAWWVATELFSIPPFVLPSPLAVAMELADSPLLYLRAARATLAKILLGGFTGVAAGFVTGVLISHVPLLRRAVLPYLVAFRVLPKVAIAPVLLLYIGVGFGTAILFVALVSFFPMAVSTAAGFDRVPRRQRDLLRSVDAGAVRSVVAVELPYALPDLFAGLKQSVALSVIGAVIAEWIVATDGLGYLILIASETVQIAVMLAALGVLVFLGLFLYGGVSLLQRRLGYH